MKNLHFSLPAFGVGFMFAFYFIGLMNKLHITGHMKENAMTLPLWVYIVSLILFIACGVLFYILEGKYWKDVKELRGTVDQILNSNNLILKKKEESKREVIHGLDVLPQKKCSCCKRPFWLGGGRWRVQFYIKHREGKRLFERTVCKKCYKDYQNTCSKLADKVNISMEEGVDG